VSIWNVSPSPVKELVDTAGDVRQESYRPSKTRRRPCTAEHDDPQPWHAGHEEHAAPDGGRQDGLAKVGLGDEQRRDDAEEDDGEEVAGDVRLAGMFGETARRR
jgi:hypothetical protein